MASGFSFSVKGLDKVLVLFNQLPKRVQTELKAELEITAKEIRDGAKSDAPVDEARIKNSISYQKTGPTSYEIVAQTLYAGYQEFGTKSKTVIPPGLESTSAQLRGKSQSSGDPLKALEGWVKRKGIAATYSVKTKRRTRSKSEAKLTKQIAFLIWRSIRKFGIKPHPYFFKQMKTAEPKLRDRVANIIKRII